VKIETFITSKQLVSDLVQSKEMSQDIIKQDVKVEEVDRKLTKEQMEKTVESLNGFVSPTQTSLRFTLHEKLNEYYVQVVDSNTKEVVREIPSKKMMDFYASMKENIGIFIDKKI
jgi:flagellar protein FlaG